MFNVYTIVPSYCDRDAISGWAAHRHPYTFLTAGGAQAVATLIGEDADPVYTVVVPVGASPFDHRAQVHATVDAADLDIPF